MPAALPQIHLHHDRPPGERLTVLIAHDHPLIIAGIRCTLEHLPDIQVVGEAGSAQELMDLVDRRRPDVVLMGLGLPGLAGLEMVEQIRRRRSGTGAVVLSLGDDPEAIHAALRAGAGACVPRSAPIAEIPLALRRAARLAGGGSLGSAAGGSVGRAAGGSAAPWPEPPQQQPSSSGGLTERERSILSAVATGRTTATISRELWISEHTIKFHLTNIYRKLGVRNRAGAVRWALQNGLG